MEVRLRAGDDIIPVEVGAASEERRTCRVGDRTCTVEVLHVSSNRVLVLIDGQPVDALVGREGGAIAVAVGGATYRFATARPGEAAGARPRAPHSGRIAAPMPGRILNVLVAPGDRVAPGQAVVLLEAMKMEHTLCAEAEGDVAAVLVRPGDMVDAAQLLLEITPAAAP